MSNIATWVRMQATDVESDGTAAATIVLEGVDGTTWGTWRIATRKLEDTVGAIEAAQSMLGEELPTGKHKARLVAYDATEQKQLAVLPLTILGKSSAAAAASQEALGMQRAVALAVQNFAAMSDGLRHENERLRERNDELLDGYSTAIGKLLEIQATLIESAKDQKREDKREERLDALWEDVRPLFSVGASIIADSVIKKFEELKQEREARKGKNAPPPPTVTGTGAPPANGLGGKPAGPPLPGAPEGSPGPAPDSPTGGQGTDRSVPSGGGSGDSGDDPPRAPEVKPKPRRVRTRKTQPNSVHRTKGKKS